MGIIRMNDTHIFYMTFATVLRSLTVLCTRKYNK